MNETITLRREDGIYWLGIGRTVTACVTLAIAFRIIGAHIRN